MCTHFTYIYTYIYIFKNRITEEEGEMKRHFHLVVPFTDVCYNQVWGRLKAAARNSTGFFP